jgi:hypothetical protein
VDVGGRISLLAFVLFSGSPTKLLDFRVKHKLNPNQDWLRLESLGLGGLGLMGDLESFLRYRCLGLVTHPQDPRAAK